MEKKTKVAFRELANSVVCDVEVEAVGDEKDVNNEEINRQAKELFTDAMRFSALKTMEKSR